MNSKPMKRRPKPMNISAKSLPFVFFEKRNGRATAMEKRESMVISTENPKRATIQPVTVVPMFAPNITPIAEKRFISPAFTKDTTMTVVADDDWMTTVIKKPVITDSNLLPVIISSVLLSLPDADFCNPSDNICIPNKKSPTEPIILTIDINKSMEKD